MDVLQRLQLMNLQFMQLVVEAQCMYLVLRDKEGKKRKRRTCWVRPWLKPERRLAVGHYHQLMEELLDSPSMPSPLTS